MLNTYVPKSSHPWRRYRNRADLPVKELPKSRIAPFLKELAENWDTYDIGLRDNISSGRIKFMTDSNIALWLIEHLNRNFVGFDYEEDIYE